MQKLFKRSLATVLALMMVLTMFAGAITASADALEPYTSYKGAEENLYHIANAGLENFADDGNAIHMQYMAQHFVPATSTISGINLLLKYLGGSAVMHVEIREGGANGTAIFTKDIPVTAKGDFAAWYALDFGENVEVTAGAQYAFAFWFASKSGGDAALACGSNTGSDLDLWRYKRYSDADTKYEPDAVTLKKVDGDGAIVGFEIISEKVADAIPGEVVFFDGFMPHHAADRGKWEKDSNNYLTGDFAYRAMADFRNGDKLSNSRLYRDDPVDITGLYNENGEFYLTFDFYADPDYIGKADHYDNDNNLVETKNFGLENVRLHVMLYSKGDVNAAAGEPKQAKQAIEITRWERGHANATEENDWNMFGLENGLQPGWNRMAIKLTDKDGVLSYAKAGNEASWDPTKMWGINFSMRCANWQDKFDQHGTVETVFDNFKFMSVEAYEETVAPIDYNYQFRNCDNTGWQNTPRGEFYDDTATFTEGTGAIRTALDWRSGSKLMNAWLGSIDGRQANTDTLDISKAVDKNGDFYITFDLWADPEYTTEAKNYDETTGEVANVLGTGLNGGRLVVGLVARGEAQTTTSMDSGEVSLEVIKPEGTDWTTFGLADGLQPGWNHIAIKANVNNLKSGKEAYWDASKIWGVKFNYDRLNWKDPKEAHGTVEIRFDDLRFMSVAAYEADAARVNAAKDAIAAIAEVKNASDEAGIAKATEAYKNVPANAKYLVTNYDKMKDLNVVVDMALEGANREDPGMGWIMIGNGPDDNTPYKVTPTPWTETYTEGTHAAKVQWGEGSQTTKMHISVMGIDKTWDLTDAEYITFDMYVHGWKIGDTGPDANFGFGTPKDAGSWGNQDVAWIGKDKVLSWATNLQEGWNHIVIEIPASARRTGIGNMRLFFEGGIAITAPEGDVAYAIFDDFRAVNANGLLIDNVRTQAKSVISQIACAKTAEEIAAAKEAYAALTEEQQAYVTNLAVLDVKEADIAAAAAFDAQVEALGTVTYASKAAVEAARAAYDALSDYAKGFVAKLADLEAAEVVIATEQAAGDAVAEQIDALPTPTDLTLNDEAAVKAAEDAYAALAEDTKAVVTNYDVLVAARAQINVLKAEAGDAALAAAIDSAIEALAAAADVTVADEAAINAADALYNEATDSVKEYVKAENVEKLAAVKAALAVQKADKADAEVVAAQIAALNVQSLDDKAAVEAVKAAYEALNDSAKKYVANKDALDAALAAIAQMEKDIADAAAFAELVSTLPEEITLADKEVVEALNAAYAALSAEAVALVDAEVLATYRAAKNVIAALQPYDVSFRTFDKTRLDDLNIEDIGAGVWSAGQKSDIPAEGTQYMFAKALKETNRVMLYVYGHKQNKFIDADGNNEEGCAQIYVSDIRDMYISFDFYVSDASVVSAPADAGFGIDTKEGGGSSAWGNTFNLKRSDVLNTLKTLKDGWNHIVLPLYWKSVSLGQQLSGQALTVESFRFYMVDIKVPVDFVTGLDDIRFVNGMALESIDAKRAAAKEITYGIRNFAEDATAEDFYKLYVAYNALEKEFQDVVIGWDAFIEANAEFKAAADEKLATDKAAADPVIEAIAALDKEITVDDKDAIEAAEAALAALTEDQKVLVNNAYILAAAREAYEAAVQYAADKAAADAVDALINALPKTVSDTDVADEDAIKAAREAYDALTDAQKKLVVGLENLINAEANILVAKDIAAADAVEALINALPTPTDVDADDQEAIEAAKAAYDALTEVQKNLLDAAAAEKLAACVAALEEALSVKMGDLNGDGKVDAKDALIVLKISVKKVTPTDVEKTAADVNEDQKIDAKDALEILKYSVKKASALDKFYKEA